MADVICEQPLSVSSLQIAVELARDEKVSFRAGLKWSADTAENAPGGEQRGAEDQFEIQHKNFQKEFNNLKPGD